MKQIFKERLEKLGNHLLTGRLLHVTFDFSSFNNINIGVEAYETIKGINNCGTNGCAIGEMPLLDPNWIFVKTSLSYIPILKKYENDKSVLPSKRTDFSINQYFGTNNETRNKLFYPGDPDEHHEKYGSEESAGSEYVPYDEWCKEEGYLTGDATREEVGNRILEFVKNN